MTAERWNVSPAATLSINRDGSARQAAPTRLIWMFIGAYTQTESHSNDIGAGWAHFFFLLYLINKLF